MFLCNFGINSCGIPVRACSFNVGGSVFGGGVFGGGVFGVGGGGGVGVDVFGVGGGVFGGVGGVGVFGGVFGVNRGSVRIGLDKFNFLYKRIFCNARIFLSRCVFSAELIRKCVFVSILLRI